MTRIIVSALYSLNAKWQEAYPNEGSVFYQRVGRVYKMIPAENGRMVPYTLYHQAESRAVLDQVRGLSGRRRRRGRSYGLGFTRRGSASHWKSLMPRRLSPLEASFPVPEDFVILARRWRSDAIDTLLDFIWKGLDRLNERGYSFDADQENLEREISQLLAPEIRDAMSGEEPYYIEHSPFESETRQAAPAQPPEYDLGSFSEQTAVPSGR